MDKSAEDRWTEAVVQHRANRERLFNKHQGPENVSRIVADSIGTILSEWTNIFDASWHRLEPEYPAVHAKEASDKITQFISEEEASAMKTLDMLWPGANQVAVQQGKTNLNRALAILRTKCLEHISNLQAERQRAISKEHRERGERRWDNMLTAFLSLVVGIVVAIVTVQLTDSANRKFQASIEQGQKQTASYDERRQTYFALTGLIDRLESIHSTRAQYQVMAQMHKFNYDVLKREAELSLYAKATENSNHSIDQILPVRQQVLELAHKIETQFELTPSMKKNLAAIRNFRSFDINVKMELESKGYSKDDMAQLIYNINQKTLSEGKARIEADLQKRLSGPARDLLRELRKQIDK